MLTGIVLLDETPRECIVNRAGVSYLEFRKTLKPHYMLVWTQLLAGHAILVLTALATIWADVHFPRWFPVTMGVAAIVFGYTHHYIGLFFHGAAHYNLAANHRLNDWLANIFIGVFPGQDIRFYRPIHMLHHRFLGTSEDTENYYFQELTVWFLVKSLLGLTLWEAFRGTHRPSQTELTDSPSAQSRFNGYFLCGLTLNASICLGSLALGYYSLAIAWGYGYLALLPLFNSVRQLLEHRDLSASPLVDYSKVGHGPVNRLFGVGVVASTFGAAGFNRHLLHHWDPSLPYTCLKEVEDFLLDTQVAACVRQHRTSYGRVFAELFL